MTVFAYRAMNRRGRVIRGEMEAINIIDLELRLKRMELDFINGEARSANGLAWRRSRVPRRELIDFCFHLEQLVRAGVPIVEALSDLRDSTTHTRFRQTVAVLVESIEGGRSLSQAMAEQPQAFDGVFCALVRAGESTGNIPEVLEKLNASLKRDEELASYAQRILIYPAIVLSIVLVAMAVAMVFVVPELSRLFMSTGQQLPLHTRMLVGMSNFVVANLLWIALCLPAALLLFATLLQRHAPTRLAVDRWKLAAPLFGNVYRKVILARFAGLFAMMYASGIAIIDAVRISQDIAGNVVVKQAFKRIEQLIAEGHNVTAAFTRVGLFPPLVIRMLRIGENTGALDRALQNVGQFYERDVRESVLRLQASMEPLLTLLLGALLLWVMTAVLGPIYDIITRMQL